MSEIHDFSSSELLPGYLGSDEKYLIEWDGKWCMLKFGEVLDPNPKRPMQASYEHSTYSEYLGSSIFRALGISAQEVALGVHNGRSAVACVDFVRNDERDVELIEFAALQNSSYGGSSTSKRIPDFDFTLSVLEKHPFLEPIRSEAIRRFWQTLVCDALIGNFDRHAHNWGYLADRASRGALCPAPVYDCGSSLTGRLSERQMETYMKSPRGLADAVRKYPNACLLVDGRRPHYQDILLDARCRQARSELVDGMWAAIRSGVLEEVIDEMPAITDTRREFYKFLLDLRSIELIEPAYELGCEEAKLDREIQPPTEGLDEIASRSTDAARSGVSLAEYRTRRQR